MTKHTHKYQLVRLGSNDYKVYKCILSGCPHFIDINLSLGRISLCHGCDSLTQITKEHIQRERKKIFCESCKDEKKKRKSQLSLIGARDVINT